MVISNEFIYDNFIKIFEITGVVSLIGIAIQIVFPSFYASEIDSLFSSQFEYDWIERGYGLKGFCYQTGGAAVMLLMGQGSLLYGERQNKMLRYLLLA